MEYDSINFNEVVKDDKESVLGIKFYTNSVVKAKQQMILGKKAQFLKKLNTIRGCGQKLELVSKVDHWLKNSPDSPLYWEKPKFRRSYSIYDYKDKTRIEKKNEEKRRNAPKRGRISGSLVYHEIKRQIH
jgi:hypothetical protein